ncbi:MAG: hypothetical protein IT233_00185 [Bacteroidia bacterium]|nr:hypothetical protein [Bacteroidia bacterium]
MKRSLTFFVLFTALMLLTPPVQSQCKGFVKKSALPKLSPFISNGQSNNTTMRPGDNAEIIMNFFSGQDYRIVVTGQPILGTVQFKVKDMTGNVLYNSAEHDDADFFDFRVNNTQQLKVEVIIPPYTGDNQIIPTGCVAILVGFKTEK